MYGCYKEKHGGSRGYSGDETQCRIDINAESDTELPDDPSEALYREERVTDAVCARLSKAIASVEDLLTIRLQKGLTDAEVRSKDCGPQSTETMCRHEPTKHTSSADIIRASAARHDVGEWSERGDRFGGEALARANGRNVDNVW